MLSESQFFSMIYLLFKNLLKWLLDCKIGRAFLVFLRVSWLFVNRSTEQCNNLHFCLHSAIKEICQTGQTGKTRCINIIISDLNSIKKSEHFSYHSSFTLVLWQFNCSFGIAIRWGDLRFIRSSFFFLRSRGSFIVRLTSICGCHQQGRIAKNNFHSKVFSKSF